MANMPYCRFSNTSSDLADCKEHWWDDDLSHEEHAARERMVDSMFAILESMGANINILHLKDLPPPVG